MYRQVLSALTPYLGRKAEALLQEGALRLGKKPEELSQEELEALLKDSVYKELQGRLSKEEARKVVEEALKDLSPLDLRPLEEGLKRFGLYLDWPEVGRLRALYKRLQSGQDPGAYREARALLEELEERLEEALLRQAEEIAYLEEVLSRVRNLGGPKVRRLESLLSTIKEAQGQGVLAQAEVEKARQIALELRKLVESSAFRVLEEKPKEEPESPPEDIVLTVEDWEFSEDELVIDLDALPEEEKRRLEALDLEEERRRLNRLKERYARVLDRVDLAQAEALLEGGTPLGERLSELEEALRRAEEELRSEVLAQLIALEERARALGAEGLLEEVRLAQATLREGGWPEVAELLRKVEAQEAERERLLALEEERQALLKALEGSQDPAFASLREEVRSLARERLFELPALRERYLALLKEKDAQAHLQALARAVLGEADLPPQALKDRLLEALRERLKALKEKARALGRESELKEAEAALREGRPFDPRPLEAALEAALAERRALALEELGRLEALAQRYRGLGGEAVLARIQEEKEEPLPEVLPIRQALSALARRAEALRGGLRTRLVAFFQTYEPLRTLEGETARRLRPMAELLQTALERLDRLGPRGLLEVERLLKKAEPLLQALKKEEEAARSVLRSLKGEELEALLGVFEEGPDLSSLRLPGVERLEPLESAPYARPLAEAWARLDESLKARGEALVVYWENTALVLVRVRGRPVVGLMDRGVVSHFLLEAKGLN
ncbi:coiled-coil domain-containing protein [Thermus filiformis]|uniref:Uncharacterized protein n=1 Tax=Thermus filiformis TaxID=276 RepID=A0A0A2WUL1_THEFI|nr:hypothetical protein [Thermus filiformis]KGQ22467.1 hypothetical protein THFILI_10950 [Thermus filiformis]